MCQCYRPSTVRRQKGIVFLWDLHSILTEAFTGAGVFVLLFFSVNVCLYLILCVSVTLCMYMGLCVYLCVTLLSVTIVTRKSGLSFV